MKQTLVFFCLLATVYGSWKHPWSWFNPSGRQNDHNHFIGQYYGKEHGTFKGISGMPMNQTTAYIIAQLGPGIVTDMTIFAVCGEKPVKFSEKEIISGFNCRNETNYACYKVCQMEKLGFIEIVNGSEPKINLDKIQDHFQTMLPKGEKVVEQLEDCFRGRVFKRDKKCMSMKNAMQCLWNAYYKHCQPNSEFTKNKRLVGDDFFVSEEKHDDD